MMSRADIDGSGNPIPVSPFNAALQAYIAATFSPSTLKISNYGTTSQGGATVYGMPFNQVPWNAPLVPMTYLPDGDGGSADESDAGPVPYGPTTSIEGWPFSPTGQAFYNGTVSVTGGSRTVTGAGTAFMSQVVAGDQVVFGVASPSVIYTVASTPVSDTSLTLTANYAGTNASGLAMNGPFNRPLNSTIAATMGDVRILALMPDQITGLPKTLYEDYGGLYSNDDGATWNASGGWKFNLATGAQHTDGWTTTTAAGTPCMPFLLRYEEAANPPITHPLRGIIAGLIGLSTQYIWPALHYSAGPTGYDYTTGVLPMGARVRLNAAWWTANRATLFASNANPAINQAVGDCLATYGMFIDDETSGLVMQIDNSQDSRWIYDDLLSLDSSFPITAFETIDTVKPQFTVSGPAIGTTGTQLTYTITYVGGSNTNFSAGMYLEYSSNAGSTWTPASNGTLSNTTPSITLSWTPSTSGNFLVEAVTSGGVSWIQPAPLSVAVSASSRSLTTSQNGRWDAPATWGGLAPPTQGDSATVAHAVMMVQSVTLGTGAATTCLTVSESLSVVGCVLTLRGNATIGQANSGNVVNRLTVWSSAGNQAGLVFDGSSGVTPVMTVAADTQITFTGYAACHAYCQTKTGTAGNPGYITDSGANSSFYLAAAYTDFSYLGGASQPGILSRHLGGQAAPANPPFTMAYCTIDHCGIAPDLTTSDGTTNLSLTHSIWTNTLDTTDNAGVMITAVAVTTGTGLVDHCQFYGASIPWLYNMAGFTVTNNYFDDGLFCNHSYPSWALFDTNFIRKQTNQETVMTGSVTNCYILADPTTILYNIFIDGSFNLVYSGNVFDPGTQTSGACDLFANNEHPVNPYTVMLSNNLTLPTSTGDSFFILDSCTSNVTDPGNGYGTCTTTIEHNTVYVGTNVGLTIGGGVGSVAGTLAALKSNVFWRTGSALAGTYACQYTYNGSISGHPEIADVLLAANCDYNGWNDLATVPSGTWSSVVSPNASDGTIYDTPMSGSTAPGPHDVHAAPAFADSTRNFFAWDASLGGAGTKASALARIQANISLVPALITWVRAGFLPGAGSGYQNAGHDGQNIGAV